MRAAFKLSIVICGHISFKLTTLDNTDSIPFDFSFKGDTVKYLDNLSKLTSTSRVP
ncbi:hypothetical protein DSECCO2_574230 [anaerobic digester metagenome]